MQSLWLRSLSRTLIDKKAIPMEFFFEPSIQKSYDVMTIDEKDEWTWLTKIVEYIINGVLPSDKFEACKLRMKSVRYCMFEGHLYRKSFSGPLLKCLGPKTAFKVMAEMHEGLCGNH